MPTRFDPARADGAFFDDEIPELVLAAGIDELRPQARVAVDERGPAELGHEPRGLGFEPGHDLAGRGGIALVLDRLRARAEDDVPLEGRGDVDAEAGVVARRHGVDRHAEAETTVLVGDEVLAAIGKDPVVVDPRETGDLVGKKPGAVDDPARGEHAARRRQAEEAVVVRDSLDRGLEPHLGAVLPGALGQGDGQLIGRDDAGVRRMEGPASPCQGLETPDLGLAHDLEPRDTAPVPFGLELLEPGPVLIRQGDDELSGLPVGNAELVRQRIHQRQPGDIGPRLEGPCGDVESGVDDAAVAFADALGEIGFLLEKEELQVVARKLPQHGTADDAAADDDDVVDRALRSVHEDQAG